MLISIFKRVLREGRARRVAERERVASAQLEDARRMHESGDHAAARAVCEGILSREPAHAGAHSLLGALHGQGGDLERALTHFTAAVGLAPRSEEAHIGLGNTHRLRGAPEAAAESYRRALAINADSPAAHFSLGLVLRQFGDFGAAVEHLRRAFYLSPDFAEAAKECALLQILLGDHEGAMDIARKGLEASPSAAELHAALGLGYQKVHRPELALQCYEQARALGHDSAELLNNLGYVLQELGRVPEALSCYDRAIALQPDFPLARFYRALSRLLTGDYAQGWPDYEMRLISEDRPHRPDSYSRWTGEPLAGRTILIWSEQGLGDEIMFASCLPEIIGAAGRCVVECNPRLKPLFRRSFPAARVYAARPDRSVPEDVRAEGIDCEIPIGSLALYLRRSLRDFPRHEGYLDADAERSARWRERLSTLGPGVKVGISWKGGTQLTRSLLRSIPLPEWGPIFNVPGVQFVSLQYGDAAAAVHDLASRHGTRIAHWQEAIDDYDECAALISSLDLVISVQTAVVHLTGALGKSGWVMVPYCPEWRYGFAGDAMPWYPSVRVFRQPSFGEWEPVIDAVAGELHALKQAASRAS